MPRATKNLVTVTFIALLVSVGIVWASNNIPSVKRAIG